MSTQFVPAVKVDRACPARYGSSCRCVPCVFYRPASSRPACPRPPRSPPAARSGALLWPPGIRACMPDGARRHRLEAEGFPVSVRPHARLVEGQEPKRAGNDAPCRGGTGGLGSAVVDRRAQATRQRIKLRPNKCCIQSARSLKASCNLVFCPMRRRIDDHVVPGFIHSPYQ
jgi:hypothetical protein